MLLLSKNLVDVRFAYNIGQSRVGPLWHERPSSISHIFCAFISVGKKKQKQINCD